MFKEKFIPSVEDVSKKEKELSPEDEKFVKENPELGEIAMIEAGSTLVEEGDIDKGLEVIEAAKKEMLIPREDDSERASILKSVAQEIFGAKAWKEHGFKAASRDMGEFVRQIKNREKSLLGASIELSRKQGLLHLIDDIKRAVEEKREK